IFLIFLWLRKPLENWRSIINDDSGKKGTARQYSKKINQSFGVPISGINAIFPGFFLSKFSYKETYFPTLPTEIFPNSPNQQHNLSWYSICSFYELTKVKQR